MMNRYISFFPDLLFHWIAARRMFQEGTCWQ